MSKSISEEKRRELLDQVLARREKLQRVLQKHPEADPENVWHTLIMLEMEPVERLRRSLIRGRRSRL